MIENTYIIKSFWSPVVANAIKLCCMMLVKGNVNDIAKEEFIKLKKLRFKDIIEGIN